MANNLFVLGLDVAATKAQMSAQLKQIAQELSNSNAVQVIGSLDAQNTRNIIQQQLNAISKNLKVNVGVNIDPSAIKQQQNIINQQVRSGISAGNIKIPFQFDLSDANAVKKEINSIVAQITNNKGQLGRYKISVDENGQAYRALLTYRNELNEVTKATLKLKTVGKWYDANGVEHNIVKWSEGQKTLSQNIEATAKANQRQIESDNQVIRKKQELIAQMKLLNTQAGKAGISLNSDNQKAFNDLSVNASTLDDIKQLETYLRLARTEYQTFNAEINKGTHASALETMGNKLAAMPNDIAIIEAKFNSIKMPDNVRLQIEQLKTDLQAINSISDPQQKIAKYNDMVASLQSLQKQYSVTAKEQNNLNSSMSSIQNASILTNNIITWMGQNRQAAAQFDTEIKQLLTDLQNCSSKADFTRLSQQFKNIQSQVKATDAISQGFFSNLKNGIADALTNMLKYQLAYRIIQETVNSIKDMSNAVCELDADLTEFNKVADLSVKQLEDFSDRAYEAADNIGRSGTDMVEAATEFKRAGKDLNTSLEDGKAALVMTNVADGIDQTSDAASTLISVLNGFNMDDADIMSIVDKMNSVSNQSPVGFDNLANGLERVSGTMNQAGNSIDETIGLLTGGFTQLRNMEKVSTGLITISQRLRGIDEDGEAIDGLSAKMQKAFGSIGVDIEDANGNLRSTYDILSDYAKVYPVLTSKQRQYFGELAAGKRQITVFNAIVDEMSAVNNAIDQSIDSVGSATNENEIYRQSIQGLKNEFENQFQMLSNEAISSDWIKDLIIAGTDFLEVLTNIIKQDDVVSESIGFITEGLKQLASVLSTITGNDGIASLIKSFITFKAITTGVDIFNSIIGKKSDFNKAKDTMKAFFQSSTKGTTQLNSGLQQLGKTQTQVFSGWKMFAASLAIWAISQVVSGLFEMANASKDVADKASQAASEFNDTKSSIEDYKERIAELQKVESDSSSSIEEVVNARTELRAIQSELIDKYGDEADSINIITEAIDKQADALDGLTNLKWQETLNGFNEETFWQKIGNRLSGYEDQIARMNAEYANMTQDIMLGSINGKDQQELAANLFKKYGGQTVTGEDGLLYARMSGNATDVYQNILKIQKEINDLGYDFGNGFENNLTKIANGLKETSDKYKDFYDQYVLNEEIFNNDAYTKQFKAINDAYDKYNKAQIEGDQNTIKAEADNFAQTLTDAIASAKDNAAVADYFRSMYPELEDIVNSWEFNLDFSANTDNVKSDLEDLLNGEFKGWTSDELLDFDFSTATESQKNAYTELSDLANKYHMDVADLIPVLEQMGLVVSESYNELVSKFGQDNVSTLSPEDLQIAYSVSDGTISSWDELIARIAEAKAEATTFDTTKFETSMKAVDALNTALSAQSSQGYLKTSDIKTLLEADPNYEAALQETAAGLTLNTQKAKELTEQNLALRDAEAKAAEASAKMKLAKNTKDMESLAGSTDNYQKLLKAIDDGTISDVAQQIDMSASKLGEFQDLADDNDGLRESIAYWQQIQYELLGANSLLKQYNDAQSTPDESDAYAAIVKGRENADELYKNGWITKDDFTSYANLVAGYGESNIEAIQNYKKNVERLKKYMTTDKSGNVTSKGLEKFLQDSIKSGGIDITKDANGNDLYNIKSMDELAKKMNVTTEFAEDMIRALNDAGYSFPIVATEAYKYSKALKEVDYGGEDAVESVKSVIEQLQAAQDNGDDVSSSFQEVADAIAKLEEAGQDTSSLKQLFAILTGQEYTPEVKFEADTSEVEQAAEEASKPETKRFTFVANADQLNNQINQLKLGQTVNFTAQVNGENKVVNATKDQNGVIHYTADMDGVETELNQVRNEKGSVYFEADTSEVDKAKKEMEKPTSSEHTTYNNTVNNTTTTATDNASGKVNDVVNKANSSKATITVDATTGVAQGKIRKFLQYIAGVKPKINIAANANNLRSSISNILNRSWSIKVKANVSGMPKSAEASGTLRSHASGTIVEKSGTAYNVLNMKAHASGTPVGLKTDEEAVVNECGNEAIIRSGYLYEIPGGTHIQSLKKGDVIINARDWAAIKKNGGVSKFAGKAYANGTVSVRDMVSTGIPAHYNSSSVGSKIVTTAPSSSSSTSKKKTTAKKTSNKKTSSGTSSSKAEDLLDWIEIKISRIEDIISNLGTTATSTFASWSNRAKDLSSELSKVTEEIGIQTDAYDRYIKQANSVGLKESIAKLVRNGKIDITKYDDKTKEKISDYQNWYDKAVDCKNAIVELKEKEKELIQQKFDDIATRYDGYISLIENKAKRIEELISQTEAKGLAVSEKYYTQQVADENSKIERLTAQRNEQVKALADALRTGTVVEDSEAWYEMNQAIDDTTQSIYECNTSVLELNNSIRQLSWDRFDSLQDKISLVADEANFMVGIMESSKLFDDLGKITDTGMATMGLYAQNYNVYMNQADRYAKEIESINAELSKSENKYNDDLINRKQELIKAQQDAINAANGEKNAIKDLISEGFDAELSSLQGLIDKYEEALDSEADLYTYQKNVKDQTDNIASLQKQILSYQGDTSEEGRLKLQQAQAKLKDAQTDLKETEMDKNIEAQKEILSDMYDDYEDYLNEKLDDMDTLIRDAIDSINSNSVSIGNTLADEASKVGYDMSNTMTSIWNDSSNIITTYGNQFLAGQTSTNTALNSIYQWLNSKTAYENSQANSNITTANNNGSENLVNAASKTQQTTTSKPATSTANKTQSTTKTTTTTAPKTSYQKVSSISGTITSKSSASKIKAVQYALKQLGYYKGSIDGKWSNTLKNAINKFQKVEKVDSGGGSANIGDKTKKAFKKHGYASGVYNLKEDELAWTQEKGTEAIIRPDGAILTPLSRGDSVLNADATKNMFNLFNDPSRFLNMQPVINSTMNNTFNNSMYVDMNVDGVKDIDDLMYQMQHNKKFEKMMQAMTIDQLSPNASSLKKYKY